MVCRIRELAMAMPTTQAIIPHMSLYAIPTDNQSNFQKDWTPLLIKCPNCQTQQPTWLDPFHMGYPLILYPSPAIQRPSFHSNAWPHWAHLGRPSLGPQPSSPAVGAVPPLLPSSTTQDPSLPLMWPTRLSVTFQKCMSHWARCNANYANNST